MGQSHQVLIIEPRRSVRTMLEMILCGEGLQVFSAASLRSALLQLRVLRPELIILGATNAARDGSSPVPEIRALSPAQVLALEGAGGGEPAHGADRTLAYPFGASELCAIVWLLLEGSTPVMGRIVD